MLSSPMKVVMKESLYEKIRIKFTQIIKFSLFVSFLLEF